MATKQEHAKKIHTKLANDTKKKVLSIHLKKYMNEHPILHANINLHT